MSEIDTTRRWRRNKNRPMEIEDDRGKTIAQITMLSGSTDIHLDAEVRLIAAAPEPLLALKHAYYELSQIEQSQADIEINERTLANARAAIDSVMGEIPDEGLLHT